MNLLLQIIYQLIVLFIIFLLVWNIVVDIIKSIKENKPFNKKNIVLSAMVLLVLVIRLFLIK